MSDPITVLIVDDHEVVRQGVRAFLKTQRDLMVVGAAASGEEALRLAGEHVPDVVLMDLLMPGMDGVEAIRRLKQLSPRTQLLVLTSYDQDEHVFPAIRAGALSGISISAIWPRTTAPIKYHAGAIALPVTWINQVITSCVVPPNAAMEME